MTTTSTEHGPWIDIHAHPGACFVRGLPETNPLVQLIGADRSEQIAGEIVEAGVTLTSFSSVADLLVIGLGADGGLHAVRDLDDLEAVGDHNRQLDAIDAVSQTTELEAVRTTEEAIALHEAGRSGYFVSCEGGDFIGTDVERVASAAARGVASITLVHYRINELGDIQTEDPAHGGLTDIGADVIREMNLRGMIVDLAHATKATTAAAADVSSAPIIISHSHLASAGSAHPRLLDEDHARIIAESRGVVGAWPAGVVSATIDDYIDEICRLVDLIGIDHVAIGTDMDANYKPVVDSYGQMHQIADKLGERGHGSDGVDAIMGGNFLRVWQAAESGKR